VRESIAIEIGATFRPLCEEQRGEECEHGILILHVAMGLGIAAYGARKLFDCFAGDGINATGAYGKGSDDFRLL
jgi:hypothetical protein